jgi:hypothetical protein
LGPKMMRAKKNRKIVSEKVMRFIILPELEKRQSLESPWLSEVSEWTGSFEIGGNQKNAWTHLIRRPLERGYQG